MNISLIGMMGSGKSTIGKILSDYMGLSFVDMDSLIVEKESMPITQIFELKGEDYFRQVEKQVLNEILLKDNQVISTGGGVVKLKENISILKEKSKVFYLDVEADILYGRVKNNTDRPLLNDVDMKNKIYKLLEERLPLYEKAHFVIDANGIPEYVVTKIIEKLK